MDSTLATARGLMPSVVFLHSQVPSRHPSAAVLGEERHGAGVAVAPDRVLTAHYLVLGAAQLAVRAADGAARRVERVGIDHETGLGVLDLSGPPLPAVPLGRSGEITPGLPVFLLTCAGPEQRRGASGHVSMVGPFEAFWEYMLDRAIMTTIVNPGLAGAPLFDVQGRLLGVVSLGLSAVGRYSLAIPLELFLGRRTGLDQAGEPRRRRAWLGIYPDLDEGGVVINGIVPGGPAEGAGLVRGDFVLSVDGRPVSNLRELYREMWRKGPGEPISFQVLREAGLRVVCVTAGDREEFYR